MTGHRHGAILASPQVFRPAYLELLASSVLDERVDAAWASLRSCDLCARYCRVNRFEGIEGAVFRTGEPARKRWSTHHSVPRPLLDDRAGLVAGLAASSVPTLWSLVRFR